MLDESLGTVDLFLSRRRMWSPVLLFTETLLHEMTLKHDSEVMETLKSKTKFSRPRRKVKELFFCHGSSRCCHLCCMPTLGVIGVCLRVLHVQYFLKHPRRDFGSRMVHFALQIWLDQNGSDFSHFLLGISCRPMFFFGFRFC